jgi:hypothetical protein
LVILAEATAAKSERHVGGRRRGDMLAGVDDSRRVRVSAARGQWTARPTRRDQDFALDMGSSRSRRSNWGRRSRDRETSGRNSRGGCDRWSSFAFNGQKVGRRSRSGLVVRNFSLLLAGSGQENSSRPTRKKETLAL